jgi:methionine-gamma-lyase
MGNPNYDALHELLSLAEDAGGAASFGSGMAAILTTLLAFAGQGDHILASPVLYGGVYDFLKNEAPRFGIEVDFADFFADDLERRIKPNTKILYTETITNPLMEVPDLKKISALARKHGARTVVDNTFATPSICRPMKLGVDIVVYSATKYLGGHSDITSGAALAGKDDIARIQRCATLYGCIPSPFDAWLLARSLRTLDLRVRRHCENALKVAEYFEKHPKIDKTHYPGLISSPFHATAVKQFEKGLLGGMVSADLSGGQKSAEKFIAACKTIKFVPSLAGFSTTISYPAKTSHRAYSKEDLDGCGVTLGQLRFSIGLEDSDDILAEFEDAFKSL